MALHCIAAAGAGAFQIAAGFLGSHDRGGCSLAISYGSAIATLVSGIMVVSQQLVVDSVSLSLLSYFIALILFTCIGGQPLIRKDVIG